MSAEADPFVHPALFYRDEHEYLDGTVPFLKEGIAAGEPLAVAVPGDNLRLIREALGYAGEPDDAGPVRFLDMREAGRNPGRIIPYVLRAFADEQPPDVRVRIIGEPIWAGRSVAEYPACAQHEALINAAFTGRRVSILCPYDTRALAPHVIDDAHETHPVVIRSGREYPSPGYDWSAVVARYNEPLPEPPDPRCPTYAYDDPSLARTRHLARARGERLGLTGRRLDDLTLIVAELTTNSVVHGGGRGTLRVWAEDGYLVCETRDEGRLTDPLAGRLPAPRDRSGGRGLLMVNHLADLVRIHTGERGTTVRACLAFQP